MTVGSTQFHTPYFSTMKRFHAKVNCSWDFNIVTILFFHFLPQKLLTYPSLLFFKFITSVFTKCLYIYIYIFLNVTWSIHIMSLVYMFSGLTTWHWAIREKHIFQPSKQANNIDSIWCVCVSMLLLILLSILLLLRLFIRHVLLKVFPTSPLKVFFLP